jgi:2-iminobutanoate/2-iminopropanoate deaminase
MIGGINMEKEIIYTKSAPAAIGPYSQGVKIGNLIFTSGQLPIDIESGILVEDAGKATEKVLENVKAILEEAGSSLENVIKVVIYLKDINDFNAVNEIYSRYFTVNQPARSCVQVAKLPKDGILEIEAIAYV